MSLINAIYFKGEWIENFDKAFTRKNILIILKKKKNRQNLWVPMYEITPIILCIFPK